MVAGGGAESTLQHRLQAIATTGEGCLYPEPGEGGTCSVCGGNRRGEPHPVYGYACSICIRDGAVLTGRPVQLPSKG